MSVYASARSLALVLGFAVATLVAGCAGTPPKPTFTHPMAASSSIAAADTADVQIEVAEKVNVLPVERDRIAQKIKAKIDERKVKNPAAPSARAMQVLVHITRYEKGNAFARAMLAGLGQIHLDGTVSVIQMPDHTVLGTFDLHKTFAWGGIYGAATSMEQIEDTFADGIAATVTGQTPQTSNSDKGAAKTSS